MRLLVYFHFLFFFILSFSIFKIRAQITLFTSVTGSDEIDLEKLNVHQRERMVPPPNIEYLGVGYDIFRGNPLGKSVDVGFRQPIFQVNSEANLNPKEWGYIQPQGVYASSVESCAVSFTSHIVGSSSDFISLSSKSVSYSAEYGTSVGFMDLASNKFSLSESSSTIQSSTVELQMKFVYSIGKCNVYKAKIDKYDHPAYDEGFVNALESLPSSFSVDDPFCLAAYYKFFDTYGTHVVDEILMGSRLIFVSAFSSASWANMISTCENTNIAASSSVDAIILGGGVSTNVNYGSIKSQSSSFMQETQSFDIYAIGARPPVEGDSLKWASESRQNPMPIHYNIVPITKYSYFINNETHYLIEDEIKRSSLELALKEYLDYLLLYYKHGDIKPEHYDCDLTEAIMYRGKCIKFYNELRTWFAARDSCEEWGGNLVTFRDKEEANWIKQEVTNSAFWIGLNDMVNPGIFRLPKGEPVTYTNWNPGEPTNMALEECVYALDRTGKWNDIWCHEKFSYVCERLYVGKNYKKLVSSTCEDGDVYNNASCIKIFSNMDLSWHKARRKCKEWSVDADLISVLTEDKNNFLISLASSLGISQFWIGLSDLYKNTAWRWVNGKYYVFLNNYGGWISDNCIYMNIPTYDGKWLSWDCDTPGVGAFVCEKSYSA